MKDDEIRKAVRERYAQKATGERSPRSDSITNIHEPQETASTASCCSPQDRKSVV